MTSDKSDDVVCCSIHNQEPECAPQKEPSLLLQPEGGAEPHGRLNVTVGSQKKTTSAYDCEFVKPPPSSIQTNCIVCLLVLGDPYQAKCCGTNFCHSCSQLIQGDHTHCPMCREENFEVFPNKELKHSIGQLHVWCTHSKDGCRWSGELRELEHHLNEVGHSGEC